MACVSLWPHRKQVSHGNHRNGPIWRNQPKWRSCFRIRLRLRIENRPEREERARYRRECAKRENAKPVPGVVKTNARAGDRVREITMKVDPRPPYPRTMSKQHRTKPPPPLQCENTPCLLGLGLGLGWAWALPHFLIIIITAKRCIRSPIQLRFLHTTRTCTRTFPVGSILDVPGEVYTPIIGAEQ